MVILLLINVRKFVSLSDLVHDFCRGASGGKVLLQAEVIGERRSNKGRLRKQIAMCAEPIAPVRFQWHDQALLITFQILQSVEHSSPGS